MNQNDSDGQLTDHPLVETVQEHLYDHAGLSIRKSQKIKRAIRKRIRELNLGSIEQYRQRFAANHGQEQKTLLEALLTNKTFFFRTPAQWSFVDDLLDERDDENRPLRVWSAACSKGAEPYSMGMLYRDHASNDSRMDCKILATDIDREALGAANRAEYGERITRRTPEEWHTVMHRHTTEHNKTAVVDRAVRDLVTFRKFNLKRPNYPSFQSGFDLIFCRNVLIYFDEPTVEHVIERLVRNLRPGGYLLTGSAESLHNISHDLKRHDSSIFYRPDPAEEI